MKRAPEDNALRPIGFALAAVVAGLHGAAADGDGAVDVGFTEPAENKVRLHAPEAIDPRADEDPGLILGPSAPVEPFAAVEPAPQPDLFDL